MSSKLDVKPPNSYTPARAVLPPPSVGNTKSQISKPLANANKQKTEVWKRSMHSTNTLIHLLYLTEKSNSVTPILAHRRAKDQTTNALLWRATTRRSYESRLREQAKKTIVFWNKVAYKTTTNFLYFSIRCNLNHRLVFESHCQENERQSAQAAGPMVELYREVGQFVVRDDQKYEKKTLWEFGWDWLRQFIPRIWRHRVQYWMQRRPQLHRSTDARRVDDSTTVWIWQLPNANIPKGTRRVQSNKGQLIVQISQEEQECEGQRRQKCATVQCQFYPQNVAGMRRKFAPFFWQWKRFCCIVKWIHENMPCNTTASRSKHQDGKWRAQILVDACNRMIGDIHKIRRTIGKKSTLLVQERKQWNFIIATTCDIIATTWKFYYCGVQASMPEAR